MRGFSCPKCSSKKVVKNVSGLGVLSENNLLKCSGCGFVDFSDNFVKK